MSKFLFLLALLVCLWIGAYAILLVNIEQKTIAAEHLLRDQKCLNDATVPCEDFVISASMTVRGAMLFTQTTVRGDGNEYEETIDSRTGKRIGGFRQVVVVR